MSTVAKVFHLKLKKHLLETTVLNLALYFLLTKKLAKVPVVPAMIKNEWNLWNYKVSPIKYSSFFVSVLIRVYIAVKIHHGHSISI